VAGQASYLLAHDIGRQVVRVADRLDLDDSTVTAALVGAATAGDEAAGRRRPRVAR
jgi:hypothetical protein